LGVCIEEFAPIVDPSTVPSSLGVEGPVTGRAKANVWSEFLHLRGAEAVAHFTEGPLAEWPALTRNVAGAGIAWYTATLPDQPARSALVGHLLAEAGVHSDTTVPGVELVKRGDLSFAINHRATDAILPTTQDGEPVRARDGLHLDGFDVHIQSAAAPRAAGTDAEGPLSQDPGEER
jgi:beta-galactosidase